MNSALEIDFQDDNKKTDKKKLNQLTVWSIWKNGFRNLSPERTLHIKVFSPAMLHTRTSKSSYRLNIAVGRERINTDQECRDDMPEEC